jgi:hypothetical protein
MKTILAIVLLSACGGSKPAANTAGNVPAATATTPAGAELGVSEVKFYMDDKLIMQLHADGRFETLVTSSGTGKPTTETWQTQLTLAADGTITGGNGKRGQVMADGTFKGPDEGVAPFKLEGPELTEMTIHGKRVMFDSKGVLHADGMPDGHLRIEGASDAKTHRTVLVLFALMQAGESETSVISTPPASR